MIQFRELFGLGISRWRESASSIQSLERSLVYMVRTYCPSDTLISANIDVCEIQYLTEEHQATIFEKQAHPNRFPSYKTVSAVVSSVPSCDMG
jgi:hypothetical protein